MLAITRQSGTQPQEFHDHRDGALHVLHVDVVVGRMLHARADPDHAHLDSMVVVDYGATRRINLLLSAGSLPFGAPPFDRIQDTDCAPAPEAGLNRHLDEIAAMAENAAPPTFDNTLAALERSGQLLTRVELIVNGLPALEDVQSPGR